MMEWIQLLLLLWIAGLLTWKVRREFLLAKTTPKFDSPLFPSPSPEPEPPEGYVVREGELPVDETLETVEEKEWLAETRPRGTKWQ